MERVERTAFIRRELRMVALPRTCPYCDAKLHHYGACNCPTATLDWIEAERAAIKKRLERLHKIEKEAVRRATEGRGG